MQRGRLSETEEEVMEVIWENNKELTQNEVRMQCKKRLGKSWTRQTMITFLRRLESKGYLTSRPINGQTSVFVPPINKDEYLEEELTRLSKTWKVPKEHLKDLL